MMANNRTLSELARNLQDIMKILICWEKWRWKMRGENESVIIKGLIEYIILSGSLNINEVV
jgi:hypothetical protein